MTPLHLRNRIRRHTEQSWRWLQGRSLVRRVVAGEGLALDNVYYCCTQRTASQWLRAIFLDIKVYRKTGLAVVPYRKLGLRFASFPEPFAKGTIATHLYVGYDTYRAIIKPPRYKSFFVLRDPRDVVVSWYWAAKVSHKMMDPIPRLRPVLTSLGLQEGLRFIIDELEQWGHFEAQRSWMTAGIKDPQVRVLRYEQLADNPAAFLSELFEFLGLEFRADWLDRVVHAHRFERYSGGRAKGDENVASHYRTGRQGDYRTIFSKETQAYFDKVTGDLVSVLGYQS